MTLLATADTNVVELITNLQDTFGQVLPVALTVLGVLMAIGLGRVAWRKIAGTR